MAKNEKIEIWLIVLAAIVSVYSLVTMQGMIVGVVMGWLCAYLCHKWAARVKGNKTAAFLIGFFFGLIGLLIMYLVYRKRLKKFRKK